MGITAREDISTTKKEVGTGSKNANFAARNIQLAHQFVGGETSLNLLSLTTPSLLSGNGFINATPTEIAGANLAVFSKNLKLSLSRGIELKPFVHYVTSGNSVIFLPNLGAMLADEILFGEINTVSSSGVVVGDVQFLRGTVEVLAGATLVNLANRYKVGQNISSQIGDVKIKLNGREILRNVGNATAGISANGDYQEIDAGTGYGTTILLNTPLVDESIISYEMGVQLASGDLSIWDNIQKLQGQILALSQDAAQGFYGDTNYTRYLTVAPSDLERKAFGDFVATNKVVTDAKVLSLENLNATSPYVEFAQFTWPVAATVWGETIGLNIPAGLWDIYYLVSVRHGTSASTWYVGISTTVGNVSPGALANGNDMSFQGSAANNDSNLIYVKNNVLLTTTTTYYAKSMHNAAAGSIGGKFFARRIK